VLAQIGRVLARVENELLYRSYGNHVRQLRHNKQTSGGPNAQDQRQADTQDDHPVSQPLSAEP
jgi:hypothetical protein